MGENTVVRMGEDMIQREAKRQVCAHAAVAFHTMVAEGRFDGLVEDFSEEDSLRWRRAVEELVDELVRRAGMPPFVRADSAQVPGQLKIFLEPDSPQARSERADSIL